MAPEHFTFIGEQIGDLYGLIITAGVLGLLVAFFRKNLKWTGVSVAIWSAVSMLFHIPNPFCFLLFMPSIACGRICDISFTRHKDPKVWRQWLKCWGVLVSINFLSFAITTRWKDVTLESDRIVSTARFHWALSANRADVITMELTSWRGTIVEWTFREPRKGFESPFLANMRDDELYWDHSGHVLTGKQVAARVAGWAGIKFF